MERNYVICTDDTSDLPKEFYKENNIELFNMPYMIGDVQYRGENSLPIHEFYEKMRNGAAPKTAQITPAEAEETLEKIVKKGKDVLVISFSSGLSGSCTSMILAAEELMKKYPDRRIKVVDSLCASLGEGLFVYKAVELKKQGKSLDEVAAWCEENRYHLGHMFTVDNLEYLHRGGRVSKATAIAGALLGIKPVLHVDNEGHLVPVGKVRGRKQSLNALVDGMAERLGDYVNPIVFISHGDCLEDAKYVYELVKARFKVKECLFNPIGPIIGSHSGPGTVALFFMGEKR